MYILGVRTVSAIACFQKLPKRSALIPPLPRQRSHCSHFINRGLKSLYPVQELAQETSVFVCVCFFFFSSCLFTVEFKLISALESKALELLWRHLDLVSFLGMRRCYLRLANGCLQWKYISRLRVVEAFSCQGRGVVSLFGTNRNPEWDLFDQR